MLNIKYSGPCSYFFHVNSGSPCAPNSTVAYGQLLRGQTRELFPYCASFSLPCSFKDTSPEPGNRTHANRLQPRKVPNLCFLILCMFPISLSIFLSSKRARFKNLLKVCSHSSFGKHIEGNRTGDRLSQPGGKQAGLRPGAPTYICEPLLNPSAVTFFFLVQNSGF